MKTLLPEWTNLDAVILAWPHEQTDWAPWLDSVTNTYLSLIDAINTAHAGVILLCRERDQAYVKSLLKPNSNVLLVTAKYNDTWVRDYAFLTCQLENKRVPFEFSFNGWGNKFDASLDNQVNQKYLARLCRQPLQSEALVCEGGALEIDENGHLLSTQLCLTNPQRNGDLSLEDYHNQFKQVLGASHVTVFENGHLDGDDTDGHIDTLVRFAPNQGLVIQSSQNRPEDKHFEGLNALVKECEQQLPKHQIFELPLPLINNQDGERLPASYANFLICNQTVICPIYNQPEDKDALAVIQKAYPSHQIVPIDCLPLVQQFGSLHCVTMQVPTDTLIPNVQRALTQGVVNYD